MSDEKMIDNDFPGPMSMVKIDGAKIKRLREKQGLTQLYLATAVQVTTDTISRWENRRYPSIKKENGLKLAEALSVSLDDLLEDETDQTSAEHPQENKPLNELPSAAEKDRHSRPVWPVLLLSGTLLAVLMAFIWQWGNIEPETPFTAKRIAPPHCIADQPFPVIIELSGDARRSAAVIIKEDLPQNSTLLATSPAITSGGVKNEQIKWLKKINGNEVFTYVLRVTGPSGNHVQFSGSAAIGTDSTSPPAIGGDMTTTLGEFHWADSNKDSIISDNEILTVYDQYSEITDIDLDLDTIEEIWLGSGYVWDTASSSFIIRE